MRPKFVVPPWTGPDSPQGPVRTEEDYGTLAVALEVAVQLWMPRVQAMTGDERMSRASELASIVGSQGDALMFRSKPGKTAEAFNALAEGLAIAAFAPGGVTAFGSHWEAT